MYILEIGFYMPAQSISSSLAISLMSVLLVSSCGLIPGMMENIPGALDLWQCTFS
jgi:hypothetical protein